MKSLTMRMGAFSAVAAALLLGIGCDVLNPTDKDSASITITAIGEIQAGQFKEVDGTIDADPEPSTITYTILDASGAKVTDGSVKAEAQTVTGETNIDLSSDAQLQITTTQDACNGTYTLKVDVVAGTAESSKSATFTVTGGKDCSGSSGGQIDTVTVTLGSWNNTSFGSSLDADAMKVYKVSEVTAAVESEIDAWFSNLAAGGAWLMAPSVAAEQGHPPSSWATQNTTQFVEITGQVTLGQITSQAQVDSVWAANASSAETYADIVQGDVVIVKTNQGVYRALIVVSVTATDDGTAVIIGVKEVN